MKRPDRKRIIAAIGRAEEGNLAEIAVHIEARYPGDGPLARAHDLFDDLGMDRTRDGTGVLLYVATGDHRAAVWAGPGLVAGDGAAASLDFWKDAVAHVADGYRRGDPAGGIVRALELIGDLARKVVPGHDSAGNELPNRVTFGGG